MVKILINMLILLKNSKSVFEYQISGKKISYNNIIDLDSGIKCTRV